MYKNHQPIIGAWARDDAENLRDVMHFVILTVRQSLRVAVGSLNGLKSEHENERDAAERSYLWGWKHEAWDLVEANHVEIYETLEALWISSGNPDVVEDEMLAYVAALPGFGLVKAGFVLQIAYGISGCLDTHNVRRFGLDPNMLNAHKGKARKHSTRMRHAKRYRKMVVMLGGPEGLWDSWCAYVAERQPARYSCAMTVSALHAEAFDLL
jgi:hypothetical protein